MHHQELYVGAQIQPSQCHLPSIGKALFESFDLFLHWPHILHCIPVVVFHLWLNSRPAIWLVPGEVLNAKNQISSLVDRPGVITNLRNSQPLGVLIPVTFLSR
jgi:hypothetical protein